MAHPLKNKPDLFLLNVSVKEFLLFFVSKYKNKLKDRRLQTYLKKQGKGRVSEGERLVAGP